MRIPHSSQKVIILRVPVHKEKKQEIIRLTEEAELLRQDYWDKLREIEDVLQFEVDDLEGVLDTYGAVDEEDVQAFLQDCVTDHEEEELEV